MSETEGKTQTDPYKQTYKQTKRLDKETDG